MSFNSKMAMLAKDTTIYGLSSIVARFLNYGLTLVYTRVLETQAEYGVITEIYSWTALLLVILTFGMETTLFRFANKSGEDSRKVFSSILIFVGTLALLFVGVVNLFIGSISEVLRFSSNPEYIRVMSLVVAIDAFQAILFSYLRLQKRAIKFVSLKLTFIFLSILLNLFFLLFVPKHCQEHPALLGWFSPAGLVGYVFYINLFCTAVITFGFLPELKCLREGLDKKLLGRMVSYAFPLLLLGIAGILNQVADKIVYKHLVPGIEGENQLGEYGAAVKVAMVLAMLTQAFRYAYEPIVFSLSKEKDQNKTYADGMKFFIMFSIAAFLGVMLFLDDIWIYIVGPGFRAGAKVIPIVMCAEIFMGIYFNLSFWYKLADKTWWGAVFSFVGCAVLLSVNIIFVPRYGYMACAWGGFAGYGTCMLLSYLTGRVYSPVPYPIKEIMVYVMLGIVLWGLSGLFSQFSLGIRLLARTGLLAIYFAYMIHKDIPLKSLPVTGKYLTGK